jgi:hypothetical protein
VVLIGEFGEPCAEDAHELVEFGDGQVRRRFRLDVHTLRDAGAEFVVLVPRSGEEDPDCQPCAHAGMVPYRRLWNVFAGSVGVSGGAGQGGDSGSINRIIRRDGATPSSRCSSPR